MLLRVLIVLLLPGLFSAPVRDTLPASRVTVLRERHVVPPVDTIGGNRLRSAASLADALRTFSGVQVKDYGGIGGLKTINVRSLGSEHTGVYIDGIAVDNAQNMQVDLGRFSTDQLRSVSLHSGGRSAALQTAREYGSAAGVHLTTAPPERSGTLIRLRGGAFGTLAPAVRIDHRPRQGPAASFSAEAVTTTGRYPFHSNLSGRDSVLIRDNGDLRSLRTEAQFFGKQAHGSWDLHLYGFASERGLPGAVVRRSERFPLGKDRQADANAFVQGSWSLAPSPRYSLALRGRYAYDYLRYRTQPAIDPHALPADYTFRQQNAYLSVAQLFLPSPAWQLQLAADLQYATLEANLHDFVQPRRLTGYAAAAALYEKGPLKLAGSLFLSVAADRFGHSGSGAWQVEARTRHLFSPTLLFAWEPSDNFHLNAFVKRSGRMPSFNDLYYTLIGNSRLRPENAWQADIGAAWTQQRGPWHIAARAEAYANLVTDKIVAIPTTNSFRWSMYNIGRVRILGADLQGRIRRQGRWDYSLTAKYSYQHAVDRTDPQSASWQLQVAYIPRHSASLSAALSHGGWNLDVTAIGCSTRYSNTSRHPDYRIAPYFTADARLGRTFRLRRGSLSTRLLLNNLTDSRYEVVRGFPMPGLHVLAHVEYLL